MAEKKPPIFAKGMSFDEANLFIAGVIERHKKNPPNSAAGRWTEDEALIRNQIIIHMLAQGTPRIDVVRILIDKWGVARANIQAYVKDALNYLTETTDEYRDYMRETQLNKLDAFIQMCIQQGKMKEAAMGLDQINKITGIYDNTQKVDLRTEAPIKLDFAK